jgi:uncharacterized protein
MRWDRGYTSSDIEDRRNSSGVGMSGGTIPLGALFGIGRAFGWKGVVVALAIFAALAYGGTSLCSGGYVGGGDATRHPPVSSDTKHGEDDAVHFVGYVLDDVQGYWAKQVSGYPRAHLVLFRNGIGSACGNATTAVGPFYCPNDRKVYLDLAFFDELRRRFGAPGDFAQAYVIAHELGHHVQNLSGLLRETSNGRQQIPIELQADCLAGAWGRDARARGLLEVGDVDEALAAAAAVGDDTLQKKATGHVSPETWTHGSSAQRKAAFQKGFDGGPQACGVGR